MYLQCRKNPDFLFLPLPSELVWLKIHNLNGSCSSISAYGEILKSVNLQYNKVERRVDETIVPPSDGPMSILIDWE
jgi:hypothetical protein